MLVDLLSPELLGRICVFLDKKGQRVVHGLCKALRRACMDIQVDRMWADMTSSYEPEKLYLNATVPRDVARMQVRLDYAASNNIIPCVSSSVQKLDLRLDLSSRGFSWDVKACVHKAMNMLLSHTNINNLKIYSTRGARYLLTSGLDWTPTSLKIETHETCISLIPTLVAAVPHLKELRLTICVDDTDMMSLGQLPQLTQLHTLQWGVTDGGYWNELAMDTDAMRMKFDVLAACHNLRCLQLKQKDLGVLISLCGLSQLQQLDELHLIDISLASEELLYLPPVKQLLLENCHPCASFEAAAAKLVDCNVIHLCLMKMETPNTLL